MTDAKSRLRQQVRSALASMTPEELRASDDALFTRFLALPQVKKAKTIFAFWGVRGREPGSPARALRWARLCHSARAARRVPAVMMTSSAQAMT